MLDPETERLARRFQESRPTELRSDCPSSERLWAAVVGELRFEELHQTVQHCAECAECSEALRIALELHRASKPEAKLGAIIPFRSRFLIASGAGLLAAAVAILVLGPNFRTVSKGATGLARDTERGGDRVGAVLPPGNPSLPSLPAGKGAAQILSETAPTPQARNDLRLRWAPYPNAVSYSVSVMTPSFQLLHRALNLKTTELRVPQEAFSGQPAGAHLVWTVEATMADGEAIESPLFPLELR